MRHQAPLLEHFANPYVHVVMRISIQIVAEKTKGLLSLKTGEDRLLHLLWKNRESGATIDVSIVMMMTE